MEYFHPNFCRVNREGEFVSSNFLLSVNLYSENKINQVGEGYRRVISAEKILEKSTDHFFLPSRSPQPSNDLRSGIPFESKEARSFFSNKEVGRRSQVHLHVEDAVVRRWNERGFFFLFFLFSVLKGAGYKVDVSFSMVGAGPNRGQSLNTFRGGIGCRVSFDLTV